MTRLAYSYCSLIIFIIFQINSFVTPLKCYECTQGELGTDCLTDLKKPEYEKTCKPDSNDKSMHSKIKNDTVLLSTNTSLEVLSMKMNYKTAPASCAKYVMRSNVQMSPHVQMRSCLFVQSCKEYSDLIQKEDPGVTVHDCHMCQKDLCNSSPKNDASVSTIVFISVIIFMRTQRIKFN